MSTRVDMSAALQDPDSRATFPTRNMSIALIGPHIGRRSVVAKAVSSAEGRTVREFATYPDKVSELPRLLQQNFDVVMIDLDSDQNYALELVQAISASGTVNVIVYSTRNDPTLGMIASHAGASDLLPIPPDPEEENKPARQPVPERQAPARPMAARPEPRIPERSILKDETERAWQAPPSAPRPSPQPSIASQQNGAPVRAAAPASVRAPETAPRPAVSSALPQRAVPEARPNLSQSPVQTSSPRPNPPQNSVQPPVARPNPLQSSVQASVPRPAQVPIQSAVPARTAAIPVQSPVQRPVQQAATVLEPKPVVATNPVLTPASVSVSGVDQTSTPAITPRETGGIQTDADVLALFQYGKGQAKAVKDRDELEAPKPKKWVLIATGTIVLVAVAVAVVFMGPWRQKTPAAPPVSNVSSQPAIHEATTSTETTSTTLPAPGTPIAKPSAGVPIEEGQVPEASKPAREVSSELMDAQLAAQARISKDIKKGTHEEEPPAGVAPVSMDTGGGVQSANLGGFDRVKVVPVVSQVSAGVAEGMALHRIPPVYPRIAKDSHVSGTVVLSATINRSGLLENVQVISGSQMLRGAAVDAVKTWRYRPYLLNNQPVAVQTTINVVFSLGRD